MIWDIMQGDWKIPDGFDRLIELSKRMISEAGLSDSQVIAVETADGYMKSALIADVTAEDDSAQKLSIFGNMEVSKMVCMWRMGVLDLLSYSLRKLLLELNPKNAEAKILLNGGRNYIVKPLGDTM